MSPYQAGFEGVNVKMKVRPSVKPICEKCKVIEALPNAMFQVELPNGHRIIPIFPEKCV